jgi:microtubule-associated serine/threonine kinase
LANTVVKVTPRVTIAQSSHNSGEISDESNDSLKETSDGAKIDQKMPCEQKADYSKLAHNISINLSNVSMSNSCGSTQLPRIAEEKDSPTGIKSDDYSSSKEVNTEKCENKQQQQQQQQQQQHRASSSRANHRSDDTGASEEARSDERQSVAGSSKVARCNRMEERMIQSSPAPRTSVHNSQKNLDQQRHKVHVTEQRGIAKGNMEIQQETKKMLKRYKTDVSDGAHPSTYESGVSSGKDKRNN